MTVEAVQPPIVHNGGTSEAQWRYAREAILKLEGSTLTPWSWISGFTGLALAAMLALVAAAMVALSAQRLQDNVALVQHTNTVLQTAGTVRESLLGAAIDRRSFILTGDPAYIAEFRQMQRKAANGLASLTASVSDNPGQHARALKLSAMVARRWAQIETEIATTKREQIKALMRGQGGLGAYLKYGQAIADQFDALRNEELRLLNERRRQTSVEQVWLFSSAGAAILLALVSAGLGIYVMQRQQAAGRLREVQMELMHLQRLALMNQTSAVLAHELNQPLSAAQNYVHALQLLASNGGPELQERLYVIAEKAGIQVQRAGEIVKRLRNFIAQRDNERSFVDVEDLVADGASLLESLDAAASLSTHVERDLPAVLADRVQIQQVLFNLLRNGVEAMRRMPNRGFRLRARRSGSNDIEFILEDFGPGLADETARRLFRPQLSSKNSGLGVGLSICRSIVIAHGGRIWAEQAPGGGAAFHFTLPGVPEE